MRTRERACARMREYSMRLLLLEEAPCLRPRLPSAGRPFGPSGVGSAGRKEVAGLFWDKSGKSRQVQVKSSQVKGQGLQLVRVYNFRTHRRCEENAILSSIQLSSSKHNFTAMRCVILSFLVNRRRSRFGCSITEAIFTPQPSRTRDFT